MIKKPKTKNIQERKESWISVERRGLKKAKKVTHMKTRDVGENTKVTEIRKSNK
jgi:hypothetical protein